jgi:hypothetical protein
MKNLSGTILFCLAFLAESQIRGSNAPELFGAYLQVRYVGSQNKPIPSLIFTPDPAIAQRFGGNRLFTRTCVVDLAMFKSLCQFWRTEANGRRDRESAEDKVLEYGSFEISERAEDGKAHSLYFIVAPISPPREQFESFKRFQELLAEKQICQDVTDSLATSIARLNRDAPRSLSR